MKIRRLFIFFVLAIATGMTIRFGVNKFSVYGAIAGHTAPLKEPVPAYTRSLRPNYPYSIIPGGAYSAAELRNADQEDPVVKEHYADFNMKNVKMVRLTADRYQYVSYRLHQKVYWTKKKLRIPKGELLLTDGGSWARARCGNRLSADPHAQVSTEEPSAKALNMPPMTLGTPMDLAETPVPGELAASVPADVDKFSPVLPPPGVAPQSELPPITPTPPITPVIPIVAILNPPGSLPPNIPPIFPPPAVPPNPPILPPPDNPPVSSVPEPKAIYLFLVTFVMSLYGLTRMVPPLEKTDAGKSDEKLF
jgi:hypothetical protein